MSCDAVLLRLPLAGVGLHSYDDGLRGKLCTLGNVACRIAVFVLAILLVANQVSLAAASFSILGLTSCSFLFFLNGSSSQRKVAEVLFELSITVICSVLVVLAAMGTLSYTAASEGMMGTIGVGTFIGCYANRGKVQFVSLKSPQEGDLLVQEEHLEDLLPSAPIRALDHVVGLARDGGHLGMSLISHITHLDNYSDRITHHPDTRGLCVLLHGLASLPGYLDGYHDALSAHQKNITIFQPYVEKTGLCSLERSLAIIKEEVKIWGEAHPTLPIAWIGHSNGGRLVGEAAADLKLNGLTNPMQVHSIAGPLNGTGFVNRPHWPEPLQKGWVHLFKAIYPIETYEELSLASETATVVMQKMQHASNQHANLTNKFYATATDIVVFPLNCALPMIEGASYVIAEVEGHLGILTAVQDVVINDVVGFIENPN